MNRKRTLVVSTLGAVLLSAATAVAGWPTNAAVNLPVCVTNGQQSYVLIVSDGVDGAIVVWRDQRSGWDPLLYAQRVDGGGNLLWPVDGIRLCHATDSQNDPRLASDGAGGAFVVWGDYRGGSSAVYAQRMDGNGNLLWTSNGIGICSFPSVQRHPEVATDGAGGALVVWQDGRGSRDHVYAQRVDSAGQPLWSASGVGISMGNFDQWDPALVSDGTGGAIITWEEEDYGDWNIYAQRVDARGITRWESGGLDICTAYGDQRSPRLLGDGLGGAYIAWQDNRDFGNMNVYGQRVDGSGSEMWSADGMAICNATGYQGNPALVSDGMNGAIVAWDDLRNASRDIYAQRVNSTGNALWLKNGTNICTATDTQYYPLMTSDGAGGAVVIWSDYRNGNDDIYAQRVDGSGKSIWPTNGIGVCTADDLRGSGYLVRDGMGGAIIVWEDGRDDYGDIYAQRVRPYGTLGGDYRYVWRGNPSPQPPYTNWTDAATNIQDAIDVAEIGDTVLVTNGTYDAGGKLTPGALAGLKSRVVLDKTVMVRSVNGPAVTAIEGEQGIFDLSVRCAYVTNGAVLSGFTLTNGNTRLDTAGSWLFDQCGGGVLLDYGGTVRRCIVTDSYAQNDGGGAVFFHGGAMENCLLCDNISGDSGGGAAYFYNGRMDNCSVAGNEAGFAGSGSGGGVYCHGGGTSRNSIVYFNYVGSTSNINNWCTNGTGMGFEHCATIPLGAPIFDAPCINSDPGFVDKPNGDFRLVVGSACIDAGTNIWVFGDTDLAGDPRKLGRAPDMGAYEAPVPGNDDVANAFVLSGDAGTAGADTRYATAEDGELPHAGSGPARSVWWRLTPPVSGTLEVDTFGSGFDTVLGVYTGIAVHPLTTITANDDAAGSVESAVTTRVDKAVTYYVAADDFYGTGGDIVLNWQFYGDPEVTITNPATDITVFYETSNYTVRGTINAYVEGMMWWSNSVTAAGGTFAASDAWQVADVALDDGANTIQVWATNVLGVVHGDTVTVTRIRAHGSASPIHYVATNGAAHWPYTNWADAATAVQDAVDAAYSGDTVLVSNGVYDTGGAVTPGYSLMNRVCITRPMTLRSVHGRDDTFIVGESQGGGGGPNAVRGVCMMTNATLIGFTVTNGHATGDDLGYEQSGGGVFCNNTAGVVSNCALTANSAVWAGGGADGGTLNNCTLRDNTVDSYGGGASGGTLNNCMLSDNSADSGGGAAFATMNNCTLSGNSVSSYGGGAFNGALNNCIAYGNSATLSNDVYAAMATNSCSPNLAHGSNGNITNAPAFVDTNSANYRLMADAPCIDAGDNAHAPGSTDLDGNPRIVDGDGEPPATVDMGCYEYQPPVVTITDPASDISVVNETVYYTVRGMISDDVTTTMAWILNYGAYTATFAATNPWQVTVGPLVAGTNMIEVWGTNAVGGFASDTVVITRTMIHSGGPSPIHYVSTNGAANWPYTNWLDAATNIQDAVDAAMSNDSVLVSNGVYNVGGAVTPGYSLMNRVCITRPMTLRSVNGTNHTYIVGESDNGTNGPNAVRGVCMMTNATLVGFAVTNGHTYALFQGDNHDQMAGAIWCAASSATVSNCTLIRNSAGYYGGGVHGATLIGCLLAGNSAESAGAACDCAMRDCTLRGNSALEYGGGAYNCTLDDCTLSSNSCWDGGGAYYSTLTNCTLRENSADYEGGGAWDCTLSNCTLSNNFAYSEGGGAHDSTLSNCTLTGNTTDGFGGGAAWGTLTGCSLTGNSADHTGGGTYGSTLAACTLTSNSTEGDGGGAASSTLNICTLTDNSAGRDGGGAFSSTLEACTLTGNSAYRYGGGACAGTLYNCVLRLNFAQSDGGGAHGGVLYNCTVCDNTAMNYGGGTYEGLQDNCIIYYNTASAGTNVYLSIGANACCSPDLAHGGMGGNVTNAPLFAARTNGNVRLLFDSPCIDSGENLNPIITHDIEGRARPIDGDFDGQAHFDMGAYEYDPASADSDGDGVADGDEVTLYGSDPLNVNSDDDPMTDGEEVIADTSLTNAESYFRIEGISNLPPLTIAFESSSNRWYSLQFRSNLLNGGWLDMPGQTDQQGAGGPDALIDPNAGIRQRYYRVNVEKK